jgi:valyl-tRNA synthetase
MLSSSLIPIVIAGWPEKELHENVLDLMETGHDIVYVFFLVNSLKLILP